MNIGIASDTALTQEAVNAFWGEAFPLLSQRAFLRIITVGGFHVDGRFIPACDIKSCAIKLVSYSGDGRKYHSLTKLISYARLPENQEHYNRLIGEGRYTPPILPEGEGWWPVISITTYSGVLTIQQGKKELIIGFYQRQGGRIHGWWVAPEELEEAYDW